LFGKNASAGVISVVTAKPTGEFGGKVSATFGNRDAYVLKGEIEGAISDTVAYKLSGSFNQKDGYLTNLATGNDINNRDRYSLRGDLLFTPNDNLEIRVLADFDNIDEECCGTVNLFAGPTLAAVQFSDSSGLGLGSLVANDPESRSLISNVDPNNAQDNYGASVQVDYDFGNVLLTSITSYREIDTFFEIDADFTSADLVTNDVASDIETFTQEFRLTGSTGAFDWQVGLFYFDEDIENNNNLPLGGDFLNFAGALVAGGLGVDPALGGLGIGIIEQAARDVGQDLPAINSFAGPGLAEFGTLENESYSIFGQLDYNVTDRLTASFGFNYTSDDKDSSFAQLENSETFSAINLGTGTVPEGTFVPDPALAANLAANPIVGALAGTTPIDAFVAGTLASLTALQFLPPFTDFPNADEDGQSSDSETTFSLRLAYDFNDSLSGYVSYNEGFKASSVNLSRDSLPGLRFAEPEEAEVFEIGLKGSFSRGSFSLAIFDQSLENFQSNTFLGAGFILANAEEQSVQGAEIDITYYPLDNLELKFSGTFLDAEFDAFEGGPAVQLSSADSTATDLSGQTPSGIHDVSLSIAATYNFNIGNNEAFIRGDFYYEDEVQVTDNVPFGNVVIGGEEVFVDGARETKNLNLAAGLNMPNGLNFSLWARNVTDNATLSSSFPGIAQTATFNGYRNEPRTYGVSIGYDF